MSDIAIRFDGLALLAALALGAIGYLLIALAVAAAALLHPNLAPRAKRIARMAALMGLATLAGFGLVLAWWANSGTSHQGINWLDLMILPWLAIFVRGCWVLTRR
jgi:cytochrome bd-type quinol oxidase subunit 2